MTALSPDHDPAHRQSATAALLTELQLHGYRPAQDEPDPRPLPEARQVARRPRRHLRRPGRDLHRHPARTRSRGPALVGRQPVPPRDRARRRALDDNEQAQSRSQEEQDGSEVRSVELERLLAEGLSLIERRNAFEAMRDEAAALFETHTGSAWRPRAGSKVNHRTLTASLIDSRDFIEAKRRAEAEVMLPPGPRVAFAGGYECNDHAAIWAALDRVHAKHAGMVLLHGGSPKGAERIAACWADHRRVPQIAFKPDFARHKNAAPFKRNDQLLEALPIGVVVFPGSGIPTTWPTRRAGSASRCSTIASRRGPRPRHCAPAISLDHL